MIESAASHQIKKIQKLMRNARFRRQEKLFAAEGWKMAEEALERRLVAALYLSESALPEYQRRLDAGEIITPADGTVVEIVADKCFRDLADTVNPQGILAVIRMPQYDREQILSFPGARVLCLEDIQDPGNLGTMMRTAEGAGMSALILSKGCVDLFNPKVVRATMGALFRVPFLYCDDMSTEVENLKQRDFTVYAATLDADSDFREEEYSGRAAVLVGNEANGLSPAVSEKADKKIKIPMEGELESLNAAVSAALLMYELYRHR